MKQPRHQSQVCHTSVLYGMVIRSLHFCNRMMHHRVIKFWCYEGANFQEAEGPGRIHAFEMLGSCYCGTQHHIPKRVESSATLLWMLENLHGTFLLSKICYTGVTSLYTCSMYHAGVLHGMSLHRTLYVQCGFLVLNIFHGEQISIVTLVYTFVINVWWTTSEPVVELFGPFCFHIAHWPYKGDLNIVMAHSSVHFFRV